MRTPRSHVSLHVALGLDFLGDVEAVADLQTDLQTDRLADLRMALAVEARPVDEAVVEEGPAGAGLADRSTIHRFRTW